MARPKPHFRLHLSIANHRNTAVIWSNIQDRAIYAELGRLAIQKYAAKTNNQFNMSMAELMAVTCCRNAGAAGVRWQSFLSHCRDGAESLGGHCPVTAESLGGHWRVTFRNLAEKHNMRPDNEQKRSPKKEEVRKKNEERRVKSGADAPPAPDVMGFASMLKGQVPDGWATSRDWLADNADRLTAAAQLKAECDSGPQFNRAFKAVMLSWWDWAQKNPGGSTRGGNSKQAERDRELAEILGEAEGDRFELRQ